MREVSRGLALPAKLALRSAPPHSCSFGEGVNEGRPPVAGSPSPSASAMAGSAPVTLPADDAGASFCSAAKRSDLRSERKRCDALIDGFSGGACASFTGVCSKDTRGSCDDRLASDMVC